MLGSWSHAKIGHGGRRHTRTPVGQSRNAIVWTIAVSSRIIAHAGVRSRYHRVIRQAGKGCLGGHFSSLLLCKPNAAGVTQAETVEALHHASSSSTRQTRRAKRVRCDQRREGNASPGRGKACITATTPSIRMYKSRGNQDHEIVALYHTWYASNAGVDINISVLRSQPFFWRRP